MASADKITLLAACAAAVDSSARLTPNARLWLARASLRCDPKGRTSYGPVRYAHDTGDTVANGTQAVEQLLAAGLLCHDHDDQGVECWRLMHYDFDTKAAKVGGYGPDRLSPRDGLPPSHGRPIEAVISPPSGNLDFTPPTWDEIKPDVIHQGEPSW